MAKTRSFVNFSGTIGELTHVDSHTYGTHVRAKRGTFTPIALAEGMKESATHQTQANQIAKPIFDAVNEFVPGFKDGKFWSRLLSALRQYQKATNHFSFDGLRQMEMRLDYPSSKHGNFTIHQANTQLTYRLKTNDAYRLSILRIVADENLLTNPTLEMVQLNTTQDKTDKTVKLDFTTLPANSAALYVLLCEQLAHNEPTGFLKGKSVVFL